MVEMVFDRSQIEPVQQDLGSVCCALLLCQMSCFYGKSMLYFADFLLYLFTMSAAYNCPVA